MSKSYGVTVIGPDCLAAWLIAGALAGMEEKVALILEAAPDPEPATFAWAPFSPARNDFIARAGGVRPKAAPRLPLEPDLQIITEEGTLDLIADPTHWRRGLEREFQGMAPAFIERCQELDRMAEQAEDEAFRQGFPYPPRVSGPAALLRLFTRAAGRTRPSSPPFSEWAQGLTLFQGRAILAGAAAALGAPLSGASPALQVALLWRFLRALHAGPGVVEELREQVGAKIGRRGVVATGVAEAAIVAGRSLRQVRLKGGSVIDAKVVIAGRKALQALIGTAPQTPGKAAEANEVARITFYFLFERRGIPESLAPRAVVVRDLQLPLSADNLFILARSRRVPARETLAVTLFDPSPGLEAEHVVQLLAASLPWLDPATLIPDDRRDPTLGHATAPADPLAPLAYPKLKLDNLFPLPDDLIPGWGPAGLPVAIEALKARCEEIMARQKKK